MFGAVAASAASTRVTVPGAVVGAYGVASGTSLAAAEVSGAPALVWAADPQLTARGVVALLERTAFGPGTWTSDLGYGVVDVAAAVRAAGG